MSDTQQTSANIVEATPAAPEQTQAKEAIDIGALHEERGYIKAKKEQVVEQFNALQAQFNAQGEALKKQYQALDERQAQIDEKLKVK